MSDNHTGPTTVATIRRLATDLVELPQLSNRNGAPVRVLIRILGVQEYLEITREIPTAVMTAEERQAYVAALDVADRAQLERQAKAADEEILLRVILAPPVVRDPESDDAEDVLPLSLLAADRAHLLLHILRFSGMLDEPGPAGSATGQEDIPEGSFRDGADDPDGDGAAVEPAAERDRAQAAD